MSSCSVASGSCSPTSSSLHSDPSSDSIADICPQLVTACRIIKAASEGEWAIGGVDPEGVPSEELREALAQLHHSITTRLAERDQVALLDLQTGLLNRLAFRRQVEAHLGSQTAGGGQGALIQIDLDNFRKINDRLGYAQGDRILQSIARRMQIAADLLCKTRYISSPPVLCRAGTDEFAVFLGDRLTPEHALDATGAFLAAIREPIVLGESVITLGASAGIALVSERSRQFETLIDTAEFALHVAKSRGPNQTQLFDFELMHQAQERVRLEAEIHAALENNQLVLVFQPQMPSVPETPPTAEALVRWQHPTRGLLPAGSFIPIAEESDLITKIGRWALATGVEAIGRWAGMGVRCRLAVNLTVRDLCSPGLLDFIRDRLVASNADPDLLEIELTESIVMDNEEDFAAILHGIRKLGIHIAIDDFGMGYSNLARLLLLPVNRIKIDRSLIAGIVPYTRHRAVVHSLIFMANQLGYEVVVEGVETGEQIELLRSMGPCFLQGYAVGRPMDEDRLHAWLRHYPESVGQDPDSSADTWLKSEARA